MTLSRFVMSFVFPGLLLCACPGGGADQDPKTWRTDLDELEPALLAVAPIGPDEFDLLAVGGPLRGDAPPALYRRADSSSDWLPVPAPRGFTGAVWWSWSTSADDVWVVGEDGIGRRKIGRGDDPTWSPDGFVTRAFPDSSRGGPVVMARTSNGEKMLPIVPPGRNWGRFCWIP